MDGLITEMACCSLHQRRGPTCSSEPLRFEDACFQPIFEFLDSVRMCVKILVFHFLNQWRYEVQWSPSVNAIIPNFASGGKQLSIRVYPEVKRCSTRPFQPWAGSDEMMNAQRKLRKVADDQTMPARACDRHGRLAAAQPPQWVPLRLKESPSSD